MSEEVKAGYVWESFTKDGEEFIVIRDEEGKLWQVPAADVTEHQGEGNASTGDVR